MRGFISRICLVGVIALAAPIAVGCDDTGDDNTGGSPQDSGSDATSPVDSGVDGGQMDSGPVGTPDAGNDAAPALDAGDASAPDSSVLDSSVIDTGAADSAQGDGHGDSGPMDATMGDSASPDAGLSDGGADSTVSDSGVLDTGAPDAGPSTLADGGSFDSVCATFTGDTGCSPTDVLLLQHDPTGACYTCLAAAGVLDDNTGDTGNECGDVQGNAAAGSKAGTSRAALCLATLSCILGTPQTTTCATDSVPTFCYCGTGVGPAACSALTSTPSGPCTQPEADGLELSASSTIPILKAYEDVQLGAGMANEILVNAGSNNCLSCFQ
jgi:hypothetical protein